MNILSDIVLSVNVGALTGTGGTYIRFVNDFIFAIQRIEISHQDNILETIFPETIQTMNLAHYKNEEKSRFLPSLGNGTVAQRNTWASAGKTYHISIPTFLNVNKGFF